MTSIRIKKVEPEVIDIEPTDRPPPPWNFHSGYGAGDDGEMDDEVSILKAEAAAPAIVRPRNFFKTQRDINEFVDSLKLAGWNIGATVVKLITTQPHNQRIFFNPANWGMIMQYRSYIQAGDNGITPLYVKWHSIPATWEHPNDLFLIAPLPPLDVTIERIRGAIKALQT